MDGWDIHAHTHASYFYLYLAFGKNQGTGLGHFYNPRLRFMVVGIFEHVHTCASVAPRTRRMCYGYMTTTFIFFSFFLSRPVK